MIHMDIAVVGSGARAMILGMDYPKDWEYWTKLLYLSKVLSGGGGGAFF